MNRGLRFWLVYTIAWLPCAVSYVAVFIEQGSSVGSAIADALSNVMSAAVLGLLVFWVCRHLLWSHYRKFWFFPLHLFLAIVYATVWVLSVSLVFSVISSVSAAKWTLVYLQGYALQWEFFSGLMIYATLASLTYALQISADLRDEEQRAREIELRAARAEALQTRTELAALRAKLNPHFLFNTLHTLMALVRDDRAEAEIAIEQFSSMLRYILRRQNENDHEPETSFAEEWRFVQNYLALEHLRLGHRLSVESEIDPAAFEAMLPPLSLQPLVENAIKHAVAPRAAGGKIRIEAGLNKSVLRITVSDDGAGASEEQLKESSGWGLHLIARTLSSQYEGRAQFRIETSPQNGFTVRLTIPQNGAVLQMIQGL